MLINTKNINYEPLTQPVSRQEIVAYKNYAKSFKSNKKLAEKVGTFAGVSIVVFIVGFMALNVASLIISGQAKDALIALGWVVVIVPILVWAARQHQRNHVKLKRFAEANGLSYIPEILNPSYPGIIFNQGHSKRARSIIRSADSRFEFGNYNFTIGYGRNQRTYRLGYARINLVRKVPHLFIDSKANNFLGINSIRGAEFKGTQKLELEGDFNKHFNVSVPEGYQRDALYILTPDVMAALVDNGAKLDFELVDNYLFVYSLVPVRYFDRKWFDNFLSAINAVGQQLHEQTDYYADEKIDDRSIDMVTEKGRRLRRGPSWSTVVIVVIVLIYFAVSLILTFSNNG